MRHSTLTKRWRPTKDRRRQTNSVDALIAENTLLFDEGAFVYDAQQIPRVSSGQKFVYEGVYKPNLETTGASVNAVAKFYPTDAIAKFGRESAALARGSIIGIGPRLLQISSAKPPSGKAPLPLIVEEYAGVKLSDAIEGALIPSSRQSDYPEQRLLDGSESEREARIAKIWYDLMLHVYRMQLNGICHGDLKASNVCLRTIGPQAGDIRATLIDFDLEAPATSALPRERTAAYYDTLFKDVPDALGYPREVRPSLHELDMACLSAVCLEVALGKRIDEMDPLEIAKAFESNPGLFRYSKTDGFQAQRIDPEQHLAPCAKRAGMLSVQQYLSGHSEPFLQRARIIAEAELKGSAFLDAENIRRIEASPEMELVRREDDAAHAIFESYCENLRAAGESPDYQTFEEQPVDLQRSCYGQAADLCEKVARLGYTLARADQLGNRERIDMLSEDQIELMARWEHERWLDERNAMGWTFGPERDAIKKTSPYLVPYDDLDEHAKESRNRAPMRDALRILSSAGLVAVRA